jgi:hypothetical protein
MRIYIYIYIPQEFPNEETYNFQKSTGVEYSLAAPDFAHIYATINGVKYLSFSNSGSINFSKISLSEGIYSGTFNVRLKRNTNENDIMTRPIWGLMNKLEMFKDCPHADLSNAEWLEDRVVNITSSVRL